MTKSCDIAVWLDWPATIQVFDSETSEERDYVPERTCTVVHWGGGIFYLSCGHEAAGYADKPHFCPYCGAKVVD